MPFRRHPVLGRRPRHSTTIPEGGGMMGRNKRVQMVVIERGREIPKEQTPAVLLEISRAYRSTQERQAIRRALSRRTGPEDATAMRAAMKAIEQRVVKALWVLEISLPSDGPRRQGKHGIDYMREREDHFAAGEWQHGPSRPAVPSAREIEAAREAVGWLDVLPASLARLFRVAAQSKRGDWENRVNWLRVKDRLTEYREASHRTLQDRYHRALRLLVAELTIRRAK